MITTYYLSIGWREYRSQSLVEIEAFASKYGMLGYVEEGSERHPFEGVQCIQPC